MHKIQFKKLIFVGILVFVLISVVYLIRKNGVFESRDVLKIGFVTDVEYSGGERINEKMGEKGLEYLEEAIRHFNREFRPSLVVAPGDHIVGSRTGPELAKDELREVVNVFEKSNDKLLFSIGGRDIKNISKKDVLETLMLERAYYSYDHQGYKMIVLDSSLGKIDEEQFEWLKNEVASAKGPVIIFSHMGMIESPKGIVWKKNVKNGEEIRKFLKNQKNVLAVVSGNSSEDFVNKEGGVPYIFVPGLTEKSHRISFLDIAIKRNENEYLINLKMYFNDDYSEYEIKRYLNSKKQTKISKVKDNKNERKYENFWTDAQDNNNPRGVISEDKGTEVGIASNKNGVVAAAFEDKRNDGKISVKLFRDGKWSRVGEEENGIVSLGKGSNPYVKMRKEEIFVGFAESEHDQRARIVAWNGSSWGGLVGDGFISNHSSLEPVLDFDKSNKDLYVAFGEKVDNFDYRVKFMKWDGSKWINLSDKSNGYVTFGYSKEVDIETSHVDEQVVYLAYEDTQNDNKIKVVAWDGKKFVVLKDDNFSDGFVGNMRGYSPSISLDDSDNVYLTFSDGKPGKTFAFKWNRSSWQPLGEDGLVSSQDSIESAIIVDESTSNVLVAYSEFRENVFIERVADEKSKFFQKGVWRLRMRRFEDGEWVDFGEENSGYVSAGNGKADPSLTMTQGKLFVIFTDEENDNKARVKYCEL